MSPSLVRKPSQLIIAFVRMLDICLQGGASAEVALRRVQGRHERAWEVAWNAFCLGCAFTVAEIHIEQAWRNTRRKLFPVPIGEEAEKTDSVQGYLGANLCGAARRVRNITNLRRCLFG